MKFTSQNGRKAQTEARRYVYAILTRILEHELTDRDGWMFGGVEEEADKRRLSKAIVAVRKEMWRKVES